MNLDSKGVAGLALFVPALTLLASHDYVASLLHLIAPGLTPDAITVLATPIVAYAGFLLLHAEPPSKS